MKDLLLYIAQNLVEHPEQVSVTEVENGDELTLQLRVAPEDMGKVIGRQGRIAKEIRTVIRSYAQRTGAKVSVDIVEQRLLPAARHLQYALWPDARRTWWRKAITATQKPCWAATM